MIKPFLLLTALGCISAPVQAGGLGREMGDIQTISVHAGINVISSLAPNGRDGMIVKGWRDNGNAHGFNVYEVLIKSSSSNGSGANWEVAPLFDAAGSEHLVQTDTPHTGEDPVRSISFAKTRNAETLMVIAQREITKTMSPADASPTKIQVYHLVAKTKGADMGHPNYFFVLLNEWVSNRSYCSADVALFMEVGIHPFGDGQSSNPPTDCR